MSLNRRKTTAARMKPMTGEKMRALRTLVTCSQSTPEVPLWPLMN